MLEEVISHGTVSSLVVSVPGAPPVSLWAVFLTGLLAGGASCAAVQGGLLAGALAPPRQGHPAPVPPGGQGPRLAPPPTDGAVPLARSLCRERSSHAPPPAAPGSLGRAPGT